METSKLDAVYSTWFLGRSMPAYPGLGLGCLGPTADWEGAPEGSLPLLPSSWTGQKLAWGFLAHGGGKDRLGLHAALGSPGADGRENLSAAKRPGLPVGTALSAFPAHSYHYLLSLLKNPINTHFKWNLKLLLCERTL